jgi:15-cis-phytoene desaturase
LITSNIIYSHRAEHLSDEEVIAETRRELEEQLPAVRGAKLVHWRVNRIPMAIHAPLVGTESLRPKPASGMPGLVLAGDWIQTKFPSSMESACASGWMAADEVLALEGHNGGLYCETPKLHPMNRVIRAAAERLPNGKVEPILQRLEEQVEAAYASKGSGSARAENARRAG